MKARLLREAGAIEDGAAVEIVSRAEDSAEPRPDGEPAARPSYAVRDEHGHEESVATQDFRIER